MGTNKTICTECGKEVTRNNFGYSSHMRMHERNKIIIRAKLGTHSLCVFEVRGGLPKNAGDKIDIREGHGYKWKSVSIDKIDNDIYFLS